MKWWIFNDFSQFIRVEVEENSRPDKLILLMPILNKSKGPSVFANAYKCEIVSGNEGQHFAIYLTDNRDCELKTTTTPLDYERQPQHLLTIKLNARHSIGEESRLLAQVHVFVLDQNDNRPQFAIPNRLIQFSDQSTIGFDYNQSIPALATAIAANVPMHSHLIRLQAKDADSQIFLPLKYSIESISLTKRTFTSKTHNSMHKKTFELPNSIENVHTSASSTDQFNEKTIQSAFHVDPWMGLISVGQSFQNFPSHLSSVIIRARVTDNANLSPGYISRGSASQSLPKPIQNDAELLIRVNVIQDDNRVVLTFANCSINHIQDSKEKLLQLSLDHVERYFTFAWFL